MFTWKMVIERLDTVVYASSQTVLKKRLISHNCLTYSRTWPLLRLWCMIKQRILVGWCVFDLTTWLACWLQSLRYHHYRLFATRQTATASFPEPVWNSARGHFLLPPPVHGTACKQNSSWCVPHRFSSVSWKRSCSELPTVPSPGWHF